MERNRANGRAKTSSYTRPSAGVTNPRAKQRAVCIGAGPAVHAEELDELKELLRTAGVAVAGELVQRRQSVDPNSYLGSGKIAELKDLAQRHKANLIACDDELSPRQERNLETLVGLPVVDRTAVILDIFADHATSAEGKLQVELAQLQYNLARMRGLWTHLERLGGGIGTRGPGETQIETDRRLARNRVKALKSQLERKQRHHQLMRKERSASALPNVALAGYTNAGKSTLMDALTDSGVGIADRLFHTLEATTRTYRYRGTTYLLTDTVGFIRKLPHQLVEAFTATLNETVVADLILHVVDAAAPEQELGERVEVVDRVLAEIGSGQTPQIMVFNKVDQLESDDRASLRVHYPHAVLVSALRADGLDRLKNKIAAVCQSEWRQVSLMIPYTESAALGELYRVAGHLERRDTAHGVEVTATLPVAMLRRYKAFIGSNGGLPISA